MTGNQKHRLAIHLYNLVFQYLELADVIVGFWPQATPFVDTLRLIPSAGAKATPAFGMALRAPYRLTGARS